MRDDELKNLLNDTEERIEIITDRQTASVMKEAFFVFKLHAYQFNMESKQAADVMHIN